jgi:S-adenosylmethionine hydrolase
VVHVDHFGNLVTDIDGELLGEVDGLRIEVKGRSISGMSRSYAEGGELLAIIGSFDTLEVAARNASARERLGAAIGDAVRVVR